MIVAKPVLFTSNEGYKSFLEPLTVAGSLVTMIRRLKNTPMIIIRSNTMEAENFLLRSTLHPPNKTSDYLYIRNVEIFRSSVFTFLHHPENVGVLMYKNGNIDDILTLCAYYGYEEVIFFGTKYTNNLMKIKNRKT